jgi:hypothetical protein
MGYQPIDNYGIIGDLNTVVNDQRNQEAANSEL